MEYVIEDIPVEEKCETIVSKIRPTSIEIKGDTRCKDKFTSIYICCEPDTLAPRYVGKTVQKVEHRIHTHVTRVANTHASNWFRKVKNPYYFVAEIVPPGGDWIEAEQFWIAFLKGMGCDLTNSTVGGEGQTGREFRPETREKIGAAHRGKVRGPLPPEVCAKMSQSRTGKKRPPKSPETLERMRQAQLGKKRPRTPEHQAKISASQRGQKRKPQSEETRKKRSESLKGREVTQETRDKISLTQRLNLELSQRRSEALIARNKARVWDEAARERNRQASLNRSDETRKKMSEGQKRRCERERAEREALLKITLAESGIEFSEATDIAWCENE